MSDASSEDERSSTRNGNDQPPNNTMVDATQFNQLMAALARFSSVVSDNDENTASQLPTNGNLQEFSALLNRISSEFERPKTIGQPLPQPTVSGANAVVTSVPLATNNLALNHNTPPTSRSNPNQQTINSPFVHYTHPTAPQEYAHWDETSYFNPTGQLNTQFNHPVVQPAIAVNATTSATTTTSTVHSSPSNSALSSTLHANMQQSIGEINFPTFATTSNACTVPAVSATQWPISSNSWPTYTVLPAQQPLPRAEVFSHQNAEQAVHIPHQSQHFSQHSAHHMPPQQYPPWPAYYSYAPPPVPPYPTAPQHQQFVRFPQVKITGKHTEHSFVQLESWLEANRIMNDETKFIHLKMAIDGETHTYVKSILDKPPQMNKYDTLKRAVLKAHSETEQRRMQNLISGIALGDRRPTQMLAQMREQYRGDMDHPIVRNLFLARLPSTARQIISGMIENRPANHPEPSTEQIAHWADSIIDGGDRGNINAIQSGVSPQSNELTSIKSQIEALSKQMSNLVSHVNAKKQPNPIDRQTNANDGCFFHRMYGKGRHANRKCEVQCKFHNEWLAVQAAKPETTPKN